MTVVNWLAGFSAIIFIRFILEAFASGTPSGYLPSGYASILHNGFFYLAGLLVLALITHFLTKLSFERILKAFLFCLPLIWIAPLIDLFVPHAAPAGYLLTTHGDLIRSLYTYFGTLHSAPSITLGTRIEIGLIIWTLGWYIYSNTRRWGKAVLSALLSYAALFIFVSLPSVLIIFSSGSFALGVWTVLFDHSMLYYDFFHPSELYTLYSLDLLFNVAFTQFFYIVSVIAGALILARSDRTSFTPLIRNLRSVQLALSLALVGLGAVLASFLGLHTGFTPIDAITGIATLITISCAYLYATTKGKMSVLLLLATVLGGATLGSYSLFFVFTFIASVYIYESSFWRLGRIPVVAHLLIGLRALLAVMLGFFLVSFNRTFTAFPLPLAILFLVSYALVSNVIHLKNTESDRETGLRTIPAWLGEKKARLAIGILIALSYILAPLLLPIKILWIPSVIAAIISFWGLYTGKGERFIGKVQFVYLALLVAILLF